jgi:hypothetical protein
MNIAFFFLIKVLNKQSPKKAIFLYVWNTVTEIIWSLHQTHGTAM